MQFAASSRCGGFNAPSARLPRQHSPLELQRGTSVFLLAIASSTAHLAACLASCSLQLRLSFSNASLPFQKLSGLGVLGADALALVPAALAQVGAAVIRLAASRPLPPLAPCRPLSLQELQLRAGQDKTCAWQRLAVACCCLPLAKGLQDLQARTD